jgi:hypothetical protein
MLSHEPGTWSKEPGFLVEENPKIVGNDTYYRGRNIFHFHMDSNLASASTYDHCALLIV